MSNRPAYFSRVGERVDLDVLARRRVVVVGLGAVGSAIAEELARSGVGSLLLIDGDILEIQNVARHALGLAHLGANKAQAMAEHLALTVPELGVLALPHHLDEHVVDHEIDLWLAIADLVVIATDRRAAQRRIASRALALDVPAVVPGLYADDGGEVFVQLGPALPCFSCWDGFRAADAEVRGATSINADGLAVIQNAVYLSLAVLDPTSRHVRELAPMADDARPRQVFVYRPGAAPLRAPARLRPGCESCAVGPSPVDRDVDVGALLEASTLSRQTVGGTSLSVAHARQPPVIRAIEVSEHLVIEGTRIRLSWIVDNATHVEVDGAGVYAAVGDIEMAVSGTCAFRIRAVNLFGVAVAFSPIVRAIPIPRHEVIAARGVVPISLRSPRDGDGLPPRAAGTGSFSVPIPDLPSIPIAALPRPMTRPRRREKRRT